jgi:sugar O-acyltransferase (sialic acid O-acetyltransferase NeuD family)
MNEPKNIIIIGAGGHAKVIADIVIKSGECLHGFIDDHVPVGTKILGYPVIGKSDDIGTFKDAKFVMGIGNNHTRKQIAEKYNDLPWHTAVHPSATVALDVSIGKGTVVMANAVINPSSEIGKHCIINSGAIVEHDNKLADYVHISPNAALGGTVCVGECTHVGIGATVRNNISITSGCVIGAGAVVVKDVVERGVYVGVPATIF